MKKIGENRYRKSFGRYYEDFSIGNVYVRRPARTISETDGRNAYAGAFGNVLEMDDLYRTALVHPAPVVVPAALAVAEETWTA